MIVTTAGRSHYCMYRKKCVITRLTLFVQYYIVVHSCNHCCYENAIINILFIVVSVDVAVNYIIVFTVAM